MTPTIGRIVHYVAYGTPGGEYQPEHRAAIITAVGVHPEDQVRREDTVSLCVLNPTGMFFNVGVLHDESATSGTWHWPERVDE